MRIPSIYLETTIFNFPFVDDAPQYKADTIKLFEEIKVGKFKPYTSEYVIQELEKTTDTVKREKMIALIPDCKITIIPESEDIRTLSEIYISEGIIPSSRISEITLFVPSITSLKAAL